MNQSISKTSVLNKQYRLFEFLCCLVYFTSYITRINFGAVVAEITLAEGYTKSAISVVVFMSFISYGAGQLVSGYLGDKISPYKLILAGFLATSTCNLLIPVSNSISVMSAIWFVNGLAQAMMWPPLLKLITRYVPDEMYSRVTANVSSAASVGTIFVYLAAPMFIRAGSWRYLFFFCAAVGFLIALLWLFAVPRITAKLPDILPMQTASVSKENVSLGSIFKKYGLVFICIAIVLQGAIRDGINTWLPSCVTEVFHIEAAASILASVALPIFSIVSFKLFAWIQRRFIQNEASFSAILFAGCTVLSIAWALTFAVSPVLSIVQAALIIGLIHGINLMLISILPKRFAATGKVSFISGLLNFFTYVGSALSTYGMARLSELFGWQMTIITWGLIAAAGFVMCVVCMKKFKKA